MKLAVCVSGRLGYLCLQRLSEQHSIDCVLTDKGSVDIIRWCRSKEVPFFAGNPRNAQSATLFLKEFTPDVLFSINYIFLLDPDFIQWPRKYSLNIHGSLLPRYRGRTPHVWAIINNEKITGATIHLIDEGCDTGPVVLQRSFNIEQMTGAQVLDRFGELYPEMINEVLDMIDRDQLVPTPQDEDQATYFGKRTPKDGQISWQWQKERILNWIRAQARPYPGAFSFYNDRKVIIHAAAPHNHGFHHEQPNGSILTIDSGKPVIKVTNGAIILLEIETEHEIIFEKNGQFI